MTSKVLAILTAFEHERRTLALSEIAELTGLPLSTTHRLVGELADWGFLTRAPSGRYQLGLRIWEMAQNVGRQMRDTARPFVQDLFSLTRQTAQLAIRDGNEVLYIDRVYGTHRVPRASRVGGRLTMHSTAVGKAILAHEEPWVREAYLQLELTASTPRTVTAPQVLAAELQQVREQGFAITVEEQRIGACSVAVPVFHSGTVGAGLGLVIPSDQSRNLHRYVPTLKAVGARIEKATAHIPLETLLESHRAHSRARPRAAPTGGR